MSQATPEDACLIFDFDGTIADTIALGREIFNTLAPKYGYRTVSETEVPKLRDLTTSQLIKHCRVPRMKLPAILTEAKRMLAERMDEIHLCPGMAEVLPRLREQYSVMGILTSNNKANVREFLRQHGLELFDFVSTVPKLSGKAKSLKAIMRTFTLAPEQVAFVGDESRDMKAAAKAGIRAIGVLWGANSQKALHKHEPSVILETPHELLKLQPADARQ